MLAQYVQPLTTCYTFYPNILIQAFVLFCHDYCCPALQSNQQNGRVSLLYASPVSSSSDSNLPILLAATRNLPISPTGNAVAWVPWAGKAAQLSSPPHVMSCQSPCHPFALLSNGSYCSSFFPGSSDDQGK